MSLSSYSTIGAPSLDRSAHSVGHTDTFQTRNAAKFPADSGQNSLSHPLLKGLFNKQLRYPSLMGEIFRNKQQFQRTSS
ncbi:MAG: hypothetical protein K2Z81_10770, partial [Cyanobacteria bacterium]|nr:hypothetical protein [Cyanobacteriota bacterium]